MDKANIIRESVTMREMAERYGFTIDGKGFIICPFHGDKDASLKIYQGNRGFACHACKTCGSVIDFIMNLFGISFTDAIIRISNDFDLNLVHQKPDPKQIQILKDRQQQKQNLKNTKKLIQEWYTLDFKISERIKDTIHPSNGLSEELSEEQAEAIIRSENAENWLLNNL